MSVPSGWPISLLSSVSFLYSASLELARSSAIFASARAAPFVLIVFLADLSGSSATPPTFT
jgi:hypothetical protein